jgi:spoIIIJ-associated protein
MTEQTGAAAPESDATATPVTEATSSVASELAPEAAPEASSLPATDTEADSDAEGNDASEADEATEVDEATGAERPARPRRGGDLEREGEVAADFLEVLLDIADLDGDIDVDVEGDRAAVAIVDSEDGRVPRRLVGPDGKVLDALQELTRLAVQSATGERSRLMLDVAGWRAERRESLVRQAQAAVATVRESGEKHAMEPMSAFERKVVHDAVLEAGLSSESDGVEPRRFVVVLPR